MAATVDILAMQMTYSVAGYFGGTACQCITQTIRMRFCSREVKVMRAQVNSRLGHMLIVLALATTASSLFSEVQLHHQNDNLTRITRCQTQYNMAFVKAIDQRSDLTIDDRKNLLNFVHGVASARTPREFNDAINRYLAQYDNITAQRQQVPLPTIPKGGCR